MAEDHKNDRPGGGVDILEKPDSKLASPRMYQVILHNDDYTPREFVVMVLVEVFKKNEPQAARIMLKAHQTGASQVGVYTFEVAETRVYQAMQMSEKYELPLLFTIDEVEGPGD